LLKSDIKKPTELVIIKRDKSRTITNRLTRLAVGLPSIAALSPVRRATAGNRCSYSCSLDRAFGVTEQPRANTRLYKLILLHKRKD